MAVIDDKVVAMSFESSKFESGVNSTVNSLEKLKAALNLSGAGKGLDGLSSSANKVDLSHISKGVDTIAERLGALRLVAVAVFAHIAQMGISTAASLVKSLTFAPMMDGLREYETQINAVQVILGNTAAAGVKLKDVNKALDELNVYADKTIYNFAEMTKNVGTFTAAGVDLKTSVASIKGIANMAALSGANAEEASRAMYQLSQAISAGKVQLIDWRSVENANIGSATFKRALAETAVQMGTLKKETVQTIGPMKNIKIAGESFRNSLASKPGKESWLTSDVLTTTLKHLSGDMTDAQLAAEGYTKAEIKSIQAMAQTAVQAATTVKTFSQLVSTTKEQLGTGWASTFEIILGDFGEAKTLFTGISNALGGFISASANARNKVLQDWKDLGGRTALIEAIGTMFTNLGKAIKPIKDAFRDIFPAKTGSDLMYMTQQFETFVAKLKPSAETVKNLHRTFAGLFAALDIGWQIIKGVGTVFVELFKAVRGGGGDGGFLSLTASIGDFFVGLDKALKKGEGLHKFFAGLGSILALPVKLLEKLATAIGSLFGGFSGFSSAGFSLNMKSMTSAMTPFQKILSVVNNVWNKFMGSFGSSSKLFDTATKSIVDHVKNLGPGISNAISSMNFEAMLAVVRTGLFAGLILMFKNFLGPGSFLTQITKGFDGFGGGILRNISGSFNSLNGSMKAMQSNLRAKTLKEIAIAIALLAVSVLALSYVDPARLNGALGAMTIMFGELIGAMALLNKVSSSAGMIKLPITIASLIGLAFAIDLLTLAVLALSRLSWDELKKGLTGVGVLLGIISIAMKSMAASSGGMIRAGIGLTAIAIALNILALAVRQFGSMDLNELAKGLGGVTVGLIVMVKAMQKMPIMPRTSTLGLILMAASLKILASAVADFAAMSLTELGKGLSAVAISLTSMVIAMRKMPLDMTVKAAGLLVMAVALEVIANAVMRMGGMSVKEIAKGLIALGGALTIMTVALYAMEGTVAGAAALALTATGMALLAPALVMMGKQSWTAIFKGLISLAGALVILGVAGVALSGTVPSLMGLGVALVLIGGGVALAGAGIALMGVGLAAIAVAGPVAVGILIAALIDLTAAIPEMVKNLALGLLELVQQLSNMVGPFVTATLKIVAGILVVIVKSAPQIAEAFSALVVAAIQALTDNQDKIIAAGFSLLIALLQGIKTNITQVTIMVANIITTFLTALSGKIGEIVAAGANLLVKLLQGIGDNIAKVVISAASIVTKFIGAIGTGWVNIITAGADMIIKLVEGITKNVGKIVTAGANAIIDFVTGLGKNARKVIDAGTDALIKFIEGVTGNAAKLVTAAAEAILQLLISIRIAIQTYAPQFREEGWKIALAIADGMTGGLVSKAGDIAKSAWNLGKGAITAIGNAVKSGSPSQAAFEIGQFVVQGFANGLSTNVSGAYSAATTLSNGVIGAFNTAFQTASPSKVMAEIGKFVGQGFAQGLRGSKDDINNAFAELNDNLTKAMTTAHETIISEQEKLDKLRESKTPDTKAIAASQKIINENQDILTRSTATRLTLIKTLDDEKAKLISLTTEYEAISERIKLVKQERDALQASLTSQYSTTPDLPTTDAEGNTLTPAQQLANYMDALRNQSAAIGTYKTTLEALRKLGLDDATYEKLLKEGTADQSFANQLLSGGKTAVTALNKLDTQLMNVSKTLATQAANNLKNAGKDGATGLLEGLTSRSKEIKKAMDDLIDDIVGSVRAKLKMKSPSKVFEEIGAYAMQGLANGFTKSSKIVTGAVVGAAEDALTSLRSTMANISDIVTKELNPNPVITPILDLTQVRSQSGVLAGLTNVTPITAAASYGQASAISSEYNANQLEETAAALSGASVKFEQNNFSPVALSEIEIYRQTRNQLSQLKTVLATT